MPKLKETLNNNENKKERIYQWWEKIRDFDLEIRKTAAKLSKICTDIIQKKFLAVKTLNEKKTKKL